MLCKCGRHTLKKNGRKGNWRSFVTYLRPMKAETHSREACVVNTRTPTRFPGYGKFPTDVKFERIA